MTESARPIEGTTSALSAATCVVCPKPAVTGRAVCSEEHAEEWRQWVMSLPAGCERDGQCVLPFRHDGGCDWGGR